MTAVADRVVVLDGSTVPDREVVGNKGRSIAWMLSLGVDVDLLRGVQSGGDAAGDRLSSIENVTGSKYADVLRCSGGNVALYRRISNP